MFNSQFNLQSFNRRTFIEILASAWLSGEGGLTEKTATELAAKVGMHGKSGWLLIVSTMASATLYGEGSLSGTIHRTRHVSSYGEGIGTLVSNERKTEVKIFDYTGLFAQGDEIVIDMDRKTVMINGQNALKHFEGDFFDLLPGENEITYEDNEGTRRVLFVFRHKDRWA